MKAAIVSMLALTLALTACGKLGPPLPPGPSDQVTWPRSYPKAPPDILK